MKHIALIMDGNRRWWGAQSLVFGTSENKLSRGRKTLEMVVQWCLEKKIPYLSVFALSIENLQRDDHTLQQLYELLTFSAEEMAATFAQYGVSVTFVGDRTLFPERVLSAISLIESQTVGGAALQLSILFCYGGRQEIVHAAQQLAQEVARGSLLPEEITQEHFERALWMHSVPFPDLIVRTGRHVRLSNFLLYQAAYAELAFLDVLWPDLTSAHLDDVLATFLASSRTFGR